MFFLINQYYFKFDYQLHHQLVSFEDRKQFYFKLTNVYGFSSVLKNFNTILNYLN